MAKDADFTIRLATPDDIDALTELHCAWFGPDDHMPVILGEQFVKAMYRWQVSGKEAYAVVAESGEEAIAFGGACDGPYTLPMLKACLGELLTSLVRNPLLLADRRLWRRLFGSQKLLDRQARGILSRPGVAHLMAGAVDARFRGMGINGAVVEALKAISKSRGSRALCVAMRRNNHAARRVFVKLGWAEVPASETSDPVHYVTHMDPDSTCSD